ncbi:MAG: hypothetical protein AUK47_11170 [Deltaproteobacteria bacterium CG2_30_63_29]|nr:MAG: hypothetical protein AUK47_11170 [Deltaproteobacteria bacterium CG2_30_63_29]PJB45845.1 MAG: hypothetical protein CO108_06650 [Deltaproteobacteria bacterium CG_4_9_14_3_um_filter_63_12]
MKWKDARSNYPDEWLVIEVLESSQAGKWFFVEDLDVLEICKDGRAAFESYRRRHNEAPQRDIMFVHTHQPELRLEERRWVGIRTGV